MIPLVQSTHTGEAHLGGPGMTEGPPAGLLGAGCAPCLDLAVVTRCVQHGKTC